MTFLVKGAQGSEMFCSTNFCGKAVETGKWTIYHLKWVLCPSLSLRCVGRVIEDTEEKHTVLLKNYLEHVHNKFSKYAFCFFFCELLNICISISQVSVDT